MDLFGEPKPRIKKGAKKPTLNIAAANVAAEKSPSHPSMFRIKRTLKTANRGHNMSAANFRKWKFEHGFDPAKKPGAGKAGAKGGGSAKATRRHR